MATKTREEIETAVLNLISENLGVGTDDIKLTDRIVEDLGADSLDVVELVQGVEDEFSIEIPDEQAETLTTVGKILDYVEANG